MTMLFSEMLRYDGPEHSQVRDVEMKDDIYLVNLRDFTVDREHWFRRPSLKAVFLSCAGKVHLALGPESLDHSEIAWGLLQTIRNETPRFRARDWGGAKFSDGRWWSESITMDDRGISEDLLQSERVMAVVAYLLGD